MSAAFQYVKEHVDIVDAVQRYGVKVNRHNKAHCPWHSDKSPSLSFYRQNRRYHCFGCGIDGDVIDLVGRLFNLAPLDAVRQLDQDYHLGLALDTPPPPKLLQLEMQKRKQMENQKREFELWENNSCRILQAYFRLLHGWNSMLAPKSFGEALDPRFIESLHQLDYIEYLLSEVFINGSRETKADFIRTNERMIRRIEQYLIRGGVPYAPGTGTGCHAAATFRPVVFEGGAGSGRAA